MEKYNNEFSLFDDEIFDEIKTNDLELVKNVSDKSIFYIDTIYPEKMISEKKLNYEEIKILYFSDNPRPYDFVNFEDNNKFDEKEFYNILTKFKNLEVLYLNDFFCMLIIWVKLFDDLKFLKKLVYKGSRYYEIDNNTIEKIINIPTLKEFVLEKCEIRDFPEVSSNLEKLIIKNCIFYGENQKELFLRKLTKYKNLKVIFIFCWNS